MRVTNQQSLSLPLLRLAYEKDLTTPQKIMANIRKLAKQYEQHNIWIHLLSEDEQQVYLNALQEKDPNTHALWGIPFAIKDNIDLADIPTTAACEAFAYTPTHSATVVQKLLDAGAIPIGKTNLDQFATGLNGTRSPWGECKNAFNSDYISGGSSSGSAVAVALGLSSFSLGTDTAGSGRVPACFNNLVGVKPSRGLLSSTGMVPACKSLDCMTIFALDSDDANRILTIAEGFDKTDAYSRVNPFSNQHRFYGEREGSLKIGVISQSQLNFFGDEIYKSAYNKTLLELSKQDIEFVEFDYEPFKEVANLLYEGPWVAERYLATESLIKNRPETIFPVVHDIIKMGEKPKALTLFKAQYRLSELKAVCDKQLSRLDCLLTPTVGKCFTIDEMLQEPIARNTQLGYYTNFMNLLDLASVALPTQITENGLPFGITLVGPRFSDRALLSIATRFHVIFDLTLGATSFKNRPNKKAAVKDNKAIDVLVCGAHLTGLPLNWQLVERGAALKTKTKTAPAYRMYALAGGPPFRPGLIRDETNGAAIEAEIWSVPADQFGSFVSGIPSPLGIGKVQLDDGSYVSGFICEPFAIAKATEITHLGNWRSYIGLQPE